MESEIALTLWEALTNPNVVYSLLILGLWAAAFAFYVSGTGLLEAVAKESVLDRLEPLTRKYYDEFRICRSCGQIYWKGSHWERLHDWVHALGIET